MSPPGSPRSLPRNPLTESSGFPTWLFAARWWLLLVALALFFATQPFASRLQMDRRVEQMFPTADPSVDAYYYLTDHFGGNAIVLMVYADADLFTEAGVERAKEMGARVAAVPGVRAALSVADVSAALEELRPFSLFSRPQGPAILQNNAATRAYLEMFTGYTHNGTGDHGAVVVILEPTDTDAGNTTGSYDAVMHQLRQIATDLPEPLTDAVLVGQPVLVSEGFTLIERDGRRLSTTTLWLLSGVLLVAFRSVRWVAAALLVVFWASAVTRGCAVLLGLRLSLVSSMLTAILTVVAVAAIIHVAVAWSARRRRGDDYRAATIATLKRLIPPIFWACVTDAAGFGALLASQVGPVRDFGLLMTLGIGVVMLGLALILPAAMSLPLGSQLAMASAGRLDRRLQRRLVRATYWLLKWRAAVLVLAALLGVGTLFGLARLTAETNFLRNFRPSSSITSAYQLVEDEFGGAGVWDVLVPAPRQSVGARYLASVRELEASLRSIQLDDHPQARVFKTLSLADADAATARSANALVRLAPPDIRLARMSRVMPSFTRALLMPPSDSQPRYLRIMLRSPENLSTEAKTELIERVEQTVLEHTQSDDWREQLKGEPSDSDVSGRVTGYYVLLARLVDSLLDDQWTCLAWAAAAVFAVLLLVTRSLVRASLCMLPNLLPVLVTLAALGWRDIPLNMGGAMIAAVSIGLTIDGSIHFLATYQRARKRYGRSALHAVLRAQSRVGLAIVLSTLALVAGFSVLTNSEFVPTATFGWLLSAAMLLGMAANLILMPVLLAGTARRAPRA